ncbi:MAG TPA: Ldh family oxidoreductase [Usitatibacter sp.]|nr:Ldh family oxidoreductase [Usitatibacter sp.]
MTEEELTRLAVRVLEARGIAQRDAQDAARILVTGDLMGHATHGVLRLESYAERLRSGAMDARAKIAVEEVAPAIVRIDGDNALGPLVGMRALREAMARARRHGVGIAFARNSNHFGAIAPYCLIAAEEGFASMIGSNASTTIAPTGGAQTRLGNNPLGFGVPRPGGRPVILDMAMSVVARGRIRAALQKGQAIPDTWATDRDGKATTDPKAALDGFLLPFGGYKGYGLALIVDLWAGVLSGASYLTHVNSWLDHPEKPGNLGHFFLVIDTRVLGSTDWLAGRVGDFDAIVHGTVRADAAVPVRLPGEIELERLETHRRDGVAMDAALVGRLEALTRS